MSHAYLKLNDISSYRKAFHLSNEVWNIVIQWNFFEKDTVGKQFARSIDSIAANIAEGFGRYHKKDKIKFYRYSIGSTMESLDWNEKAYRRGLISKQEYQQIFSELSQFPREINELIRFTNEKLSI